MASTDRAEALRRLAELGAPTAASAPTDETIARTGEEVYAGGDEARLLVRPAHLNYVKGGVMHYAAASVGDTVLLTGEAAKRLDALGVTVSPDATDEELDGAASGEVTDEQLATMKAADLVAHVNQHPEDRDRVRALEEARDEKDRRSSVLKATEAQ